MAPRSAVTRRDLLAAALAALVAGCTRRAALPLPSPSGSATPEPDLDLVLVRRWLGQEERLIARYAEHPSLASFRAHHRAHAAALRALLGPASPSLSPSSTPSRRADRNTVADLLRIERAAARAYRSGVGVVAPERRTLVAELAASEAQHAVLLERRRG